MRDRRTGLRHVTTQAGGMERLSQVIGGTATTYITVAGLESGGTRILFPANQNPLDGIRLLEDALHRLRCGGDCQDCRGDSPPS